MIATIMTHVLVLLFISITAYKAGQILATGCSRHEVIFVLKYSSMEKKKSFIHRTALIFRPFWKYCAIMAGILFLGQGVAALAPLFFGKTVDAVIHHNAHATIVFVLIAFALALFQGQFLSYIRERIEIDFLDDEIEQFFLDISLKKMFSFSVGQHTNEHSGVKQSIVNRGQSALVQLMNTVLYAILPNFLQIIAMLIILAFVAWPIALAAFVFVTIYIFVAVRKNNEAFPRVANIRRLRQKQSKLQSELFRNATLVIAEAQEIRSEGDFKESADEFLNVTQQTWVDYINMYYKLRVFVITGQYASLALGVYLIFNGHLSAGMFVAVFSWISTIFNNILQVMSLQRQVLFNVTEIKKLYDVLDIVPDVNPNIGGETIPDLKGEIEFKNVAFAYPLRTSALEDHEMNAEPKEFLEEKETEVGHAVSGVNFVIPAGAKVGFVGASGSGKSTIISLMRRYYDPSEGSILIDGKDITKIDLRWLRSHIGNVEQKIDLFDRSIRDNILFGAHKDADVSEETLAKAISDASLDDFIEKLPSGLDTLIGENGIKVSGGERQRIGIARAMVKNPKILIFDEATSALDSINEKLIHEAINKGAAGRTTIIIAHRLSTVIDADILFVVSNGKIVDHGTHAELKDRSPEYQKLIKNQIF